MLDVQLVSNFTNFAVQNVNKAFVYITDLTSTLKYIVNSVLKLFTSFNALFHSSQKLTRKLAARTFIQSQYLKALAASLRVGFCDEWKRGLDVDLHKAQGEKKWACGLKEADLSVLMLFCIFNFRCSMEGKQPNKVNISQMLNLFAEVVKSRYFRSGMVQQRGALRGVQLYIYIYIYNITLLIYITLCACVDALVSPCCTACVW